MSPAAAQRRATLTTESSLATEARAASDSFSADIDDSSSDEADEAEKAEVEARSMSLFQPSSPAERASYSLLDERHRAEELRTKVFLYSSPMRVLALAATPLDAEMDDAASETIGEHESAKSKQE